MADYLLLLLALLALTSSSVASGVAPVSEVPPVSEAPPVMPRQQLVNIIDALVGAGDFNGWANLLSESDFFIIPLSATLFVPSDDFEAASAAAADPSIIPYHIVPQRLSFSELILLKPHSRLPTLLRNRTILVTNNSASNFTLDASLLSRHDLYLTSTVAVHGIATLLDYKNYGSASRVGPLRTPPPPPPPSPPPPPPPSPPSPTESEPSSGMFVPVDGVISGACSCEEFPIAFFVLCGALILKILGK